jgi:hypothetical protein
MRRFIVSLFIGPFLLIGALPAVAGQSVPSDTQVQCAGSDATGDRDTYIRKAQDDLQEWQQKVHDFGAEAAAKGRKDAIAAQRDLDEAWAKTEAEADKLKTSLKTSSAEAWDSARTSYEKASHELAGTWDKILDQAK